MQLTQQQNTYEFIWVLTQLCKQTTIIHMIFDNYATKQNIWIHMNPDTIMNDTNSYHFWHNYAKKNSECAHIISNTFLQNKKSLGIHMNSDTFMQHNINSYDFLHKYAYITIWIHHFLTQLYKHIPYECVWLWTQLCTHKHRECISLITQLCTNTHYEFIWFLTQLCKTKYIYIHLICWYHYSKTYNVKPFDLWQLCKQP